MPQPPDTELSLGLLVSAFELLICRSMQAQELCGGKSESQHRQFKKDASSEDC